ncbi:MAG: hypothetical protein INF43_03645 [Alphaproteobacteria bacterium]|jgi:hypothetical protein|nr:hypothetical protein [Alphaproteobacteria bacterium]
MFSFTKHAAAPAKPPLHEKLQQIRTQLTALNHGAPQVGGEGATLGDDAPLPADKRAAIAQEETLVRGALKAVGVDYDALIATPSQEGQLSPYALAVQAKPQLLQEVLAAPSPTLKALEVALSFKPKADFAAQYGQEPEAIKAALRAEILAEQRLEATPDPSAAGLPFSRPRAAAKAATPKGKAALADVFHK